MRAAVVSETGTFSVTERERPSPGDSEVLLEVEFTVDAGSDPLTLRVDEDFSIIDQSV
ncbi:hypothetical protein [Halovenus halobia]|uniref:hypothetical protein n=1 Tax=Halovenus halobia TaxID=3396622 RepID=UPI003F564221